MTLVDTSAWIAHFRARSPLHLECWVAFDEIVTCLPVIQEVLQGFQDETAYRRHDRDFPHLARVSALKQRDVAR